MYELGCGVAEITPSVGLPLSGFIFRENKPSTSVDTPLFVRVMAVRSKHRLFFLINYDLLGIGTPLEQRLLAELESQLGIVQEQCALVATHTHSAPPAVSLEGEAAPDSAFWQLLAARTVEATRAALTHLQPVILYQASLRLPGLTYNRRAVLVDGRVSMALEPDAPVVERGPADDRLTVLLWRDPLGRNVASALHYACHGVAVCTQAIGGDIPGELSRRIGELLGAPCLFLPGAGGDVNPLTVSASRADLLAWVDRAMAHLSFLPEQFRLVSSDTLHVVTTHLSLDYAPLPPRATVERSIAWLECITHGDVSSPEIQAELNSLGNIMNIKPGEPPDLAKAAYAARALANAGRRTLVAIDADRPPGACPLRLSIWNFGETILVAAAAELFTITGQRIEALRPDLTILPVTCLAPLVGYVPDRTAMSQGGYEVDDAWRFYCHPAPFAPDAEQRIIDAVRTLIAQVD